MSTVTKEEIIDAISHMSVLELSELVKELESRFGITPFAPAAVQVSPEAPTEVEKEEEKTEFDVILTGVGDKKIQVIKEIRAITNLGLKDAKELTDNLPRPIKEKISKQEAEEIKKRLEGVGATIELR
ncbi:MAG: 50S ribosomal protein L7/L12 [bacterium]|nr:50S ribosomal protein L7/L12 [bacterium]